MASLASSHLRYLRQRGELSLPHWRPTRHEKDDIVCHEAKDGLSIPGLVADCHVWTSARICSSSLSMSTSSM